MGTLSPKHQERLDRWRKKVEEKTPEKSVKQNKGRISGDFGDVFSQEELEEEHKKSQTRGFYGRLGS